MHLKSRVPFLPDTSENCELENYLTPLNLFSILALTNIHWVVKMKKTEEIADILKALSDPTRLQIVTLLGKSKSMLCVNALTKKLDVTQSAVSQHLRVLRQSGLVVSERRGYFIHYSINKSKIEALVDQLSNIIE